MTPRPWIFSGILVLALTSFSGVADATDIDGPDDCSRNYIDEGDAPEGIPAYPGGIIGHFPSCVGVASPPGTMELACPAISSPPGPTGYVEHFSFPGLPPFWLGCYPAPGGGFYGVDSETEGKVCLAAVPSHCVEGFATVPVNQDECYGDGSDACLTTSESFALCSTDAITFSATSCHAQRNAFLNILVDWNEDGDWNDNFVCPGQTLCTYEWVVKNATITLAPGCNLVTSPSFRTGARAGHGWMRITLSLEPVGDAFPWAGAALDAGAYEGGETEDYPVTIETETPARSSTWGAIKGTYR